MVPSYSTQSWFCSQAAKDGSRGTSLTDAPLDFSVRTIVFIFRLWALVRLQPVEALPVEVVRAVA